MTKIPTRERAETVAVHIVNLNLPFARGPKFRWDIGARLPDGHIQLVQQKIIKK